MADGNSLLDHRVSTLEEGFKTLAQEDRALGKQVGDMSGDMKVLTQVIGDLTVQLTRLVQQNAEKDAARVDEVKAEITREGRMARIELQLRIVAVLATGSTLAIIGAYVTSQFGG